MSNLLLERLRALAAELACIEVFRSGKTPLVGRLLACSDFVFVIEKVSGLEADGLVAARVQDITHMRAASHDLELMSELFAVRAPPAIPDVALLELSSAITIFNRMFGAVTIHAENAEPDICFIGQEVSLDDDWVQVREFGARGKRDRADLLVSLSVITRVEAGGRYERALRAIYFPGCEIAEVPRSPPRSR
jgi:hypothetical protein